MNRKLYWGLAAFILLIIGGVFLFVKDQAEIRQLEQEVAEANKQLQQHNAEQVRKMPQEQHPAQGHFHDDGTFHEGEHNPFDTPTWKTPTVNMPENIKDPAVAAAWKRLEEISKNRHQWGNFSPRALELMDELTPLPELGSSEYGDCGEEIILVLDELAKLRDPRSAELLVTYQMDSGINGNPPDEALVAMGPASVPALIARLNEEMIETDLLYEPLELLPRIVVAHRSELGGIVQHIIIPKLEAIAAYEGTDGFAVDNKHFALNALEALEVTLQKPKNQ